MRIKLDLYHKILSLCPLSSIEQGGILGEKKGVVCEYYHDTTSCERGIYIPDTAKLNTIIEGWAGQGIGLWGIYHSHYPGGDDLSVGDIEYIKKIFEVSGDIIDHLYFPVVIPEKKIIFHKAVMKCGKLHFEVEDIKITD